MGEVNEPKQHNHGKQDATQQTDDLIEKQDATQQTDGVTNINKHQQTQTQDSYLYSKLRREQRKKEEGQKMCYSFDATWNNPSLQ